MATCIDEPYRVTISRYLVVLVVAGMLPFSLASQSIEPAFWKENDHHFPLKRKIALTHFNKRVRLHSVTQLDNGLLEIYTKEGLFLFDGEKLNLAGQPPLQSVRPLFSVENSGRKYYVDQNNRLTWKNKATFESIALPLEKTVEAVKGISVGSHIIFSCSDGTALVYNVLSPAFTRLRIPNANEIYEIRKDRKDKIWIATDSGLFVYIKTGNSLSLLRRLDQTNILPDNLVTAMDYDGLNEMVAGSYESGIFTVGIEDYSIRRYPISVGKRIDHLKCLGRNKIVYGDTDKGLVLAGLGNNRHYILSSVVEANSLMSLVLTEEGWIAAFEGDGNVTLVNPVLSTFDPGIKGIQCLQLNKGRIYIGTSHGLYSYAADHMERITGAEKLNIVSLHTDPGENLWIGSYGQGLYRYADGRLHRFESPVLKDQNIMSMAGIDNRVYLATLSGAYELVLDPGNKYQVGEVLSFHQDESIGAQFIYTVSVDSGGVWFGSDGKGLWRLDGSILKPYMAYKYGNQSVQSVLSNGRSLWLNLDGIHAEQRQLDETGRVLLNYSADNISGFVQVDQGLVCTYSEGKILLNDDTGRRALLYEGLFEGSLFSPTLNSACSAGPGVVLIAGDDRIVQVTNTELVRRFRPNTVIQSVRFFGSKEEGLRRIFGYNENSIEINFKSIWYNDPARVSYKYRLKGYEDQFKTTLDKYVFYTNLPPGSYEFELESVGEGPSPGSGIVRYQFSIEKPYYATWWFRMTGLLLLTGIIYLVVRIMERTKIRKQKLEREKLEAQVAILKSQINPHFLFNSFNTITALIEENPDNAHLYIQKLAAFYRAILTIREEAHSVEEEINLLNDFYFLLQQRFGDNLTLQLDVRDRSGVIPPMTLQILFENVVNHNIISRNKPMQVKIIQNPDRSILFSNSKQKKNVKTTGTGLGLYNIRNRYRLMFGKELTVNDEDDRFEVILPYVPSGQVDKK